MSGNVMRLMLKQRMLLPVVEWGKGMGKAEEGLMKGMKTGSARVSGSSANKINKSIWTEGIA